MVAVAAASVLATIFAAPAHAQEEEVDVVTVHPEEFDGAIRNPLMGLAAKDFFINTANPDSPEDQSIDSMPWASMMMTYLPWDHLENAASDGVDEIREYLDRRWRAKDANGVWRPYEDYGIKVIPRLYLRFPAETSGNTGLFYGLGGDHWPDDLTNGDFTSTAFDARLERMIQRLAEVWEDDPRVAYVQMGVFGTWGEQHGTAQPANIEKYFKQYFQKKHVQVRYHHKDQWEDSDAFGHYNDSIGDRNTAGNWATKPVGGEPGYDYNGVDIHGSLVRQTYLDDDYNNNTTNLIRSTHSVYLTWAGDYSYGSRWTAADAVGGREAYLANKAKIDANADKLQRELGYRYVMNEFSYPETIQPGGPFDVSFTVTNEGSAPMYYNWPVQVSLKDPDTGEIAWSDTFDDVDITQWQPGSGYAGLSGGKKGTWSGGVLAYTTPAQAHTETGSFTLPAELPEKDYIVQLAVLDPGGDVPSLRFAMQNYTTGGYHPMGYVGVGTAPATTVIDPGTFVSPAIDVSLRYYRDGQEAPATPVTLDSLDLTGGPLKLALGSEGYDLENLDVNGTDTLGRPHNLNAAAPTWTVSSGGTHAQLQGSTLVPLTAGTGTIAATLNGVTSEPVSFEVTDEVGDIRGVITADEGAPLAGVRVEGVSADDTFTAITEADGTYEALNTHTGTYTLTATKDKYTTATQVGVELGKGQTIQADFTLALETGGNFFDDFSSGAGKWTAGTGSWSVVDGKYGQNTLGGSNSWRYQSTVTGKIWKDATYEADISYTGGSNWAALLFRKANQSDHINSGGYFVAWNQSGKIELNRGGSTIVNLASVQRATDWSRPHHIKVVNVGTNIKVYVDGESTPIMDVNDSTFRYGYASVGANGSRWSFDNYRVTEPAVAPPLTVSTVIAQRCVASKTTLTVNVTNTSDVPVNLTLTSAYGTKSITGVQPGKSGFHAFTTRLSQIPAGAVTVKAAGVIDNAPVTVEKVEQHAALGC